MKRRIIKINEEKCDGCGICVPTCVEGALQIINGKAKLISETYCDGLGVCMGECPQGAIAIEEREAEDFDDEAVRRHLEEKEQAKEKLPCGCSSATVVRFDGPESGEPVSQDSIPCQSMLGHWPVQLTLVPPTAPFLQGADLLLVADCVPFAYAGFHQHFLRDHTLVVACPKLDDFQAHQEKLTRLLHQAEVKSITVLHMEVPCCSGLVHMAKQATRLSGRRIPLKEVTIGIKGDVKPDSQQSKKAI
jgi:NAD-dependent dihydropyrimidine dehydrogenase PreA subunit